MAPTNESALATRAGAFEALESYREALVDYETLRAVAPWSKSAETGYTRCTHKLDGDLPPSPVSARAPRLVKAFSGPIARHAASQSKRGQTNVNKVSTEKVWSFPLFFLYQHGGKH